MTSSNQLSKPGKRRQDVAALAAPVKAPRRPVDKTKKEYGTLDTSEDDVDSLDEAALDKLLREIKRKYGANNFEQYIKARPWLHNTRLYHENKPKPKRDEEPDSVYPNRSDNAPTYPVARQAVTSKAAACTDTKRTRPVVSRLPLAQLRNLRAVDAEEENIVNALASNRVEALHALPLQLPGNKSSRGVRTSRKNQAPATQDKHREKPGKAALKVPAVNLDVLSKNIPKPSTLGVKQAVIGQCRAAGRDNCEPAAEHDSLLSLQRGLL
jgi:hypothetical protein